MPGTDLLFENLLKMHDAYGTEKTPMRPAKKLKEQSINTKPLIEDDDLIDEEEEILEQDTTVLNLSVELPTDVEINPEDVNVNVGVMPMDTEGADEIPEGENSDEEFDDLDAGGIGGDDGIEDLEDEEIPLDDEIPAEESLNIKKEAKARWGTKPTKEQMTVLDGKDEGDNPDEVGVGAELAKKAKKEALLKLDSNSISRLVSAFVKDNYKNIDKVNISRAVLENRRLTLEGLITFASGKTEKLVLVNRGFDPVKLESKTFEMDFKDMGGTFKAISETKKNPFLCKANLKEGLLSFKTLAYDFKVSLKEGKVAEVKGKLGLKESK